MPSTGYIQVHAYTSDAQYPLRNVAITVTSQDGTAIAMRLTDRSGKITPLPVPVPDKAERELGWKATHNLEEMCRDSWNFVLKNR